MPTDLLIHHTCKSMSTDYQEMRPTLYQGRKFRISHHPCMGAYNTQNLKTCSFSREIRKTVASWEITKHTKINK